MSNNTTQTVPGMIYPTQKGYQPGAGNPRDSAIQRMAAGNAKQANLSASVGGSRRKKGGGDVVVPQVQTLYTPTGGPGTDPNSQIAGNLKTSIQGTANAVFDKQALSTTPTATGGSRKRGKGKNGGNPNWLWGCYSGGKKSRRIRKTKKSRKSRKNRRKH
jgi:hypothetical protein